MSIPFPKNSLDFLQRNQEIKAQYGDDVFFITSHAVTIDDSQSPLSITIDETCPILVNPADKAKIGAPDDMMTLKEGRSSLLGDRGYIALAAGGFMWVGDKIALLQRDSGAQLMPEHWTNPSGMCGEHPFETSDKETCEEIALFDAAKSLIIRFHAAGVEHDQNIYVRKNMAKWGLLAADQKAETQFITLGSETCAREMGGRDIEVIAGSNITRAAIPHMHADPQNNLIVLNQVFRLNADSNTLTTVDAEVFGRQGGIMSASDALALPLIPNTRHYLEHALKR